MHPRKFPMPTNACFPRHVQGRELEDAYLIGFEEASNGDYQDAVFLVEGVAPAK